MAGSDSSVACAAIANGNARWFQLIVGIVGMIAIANLQYGWTLFVGPITDRFHWSEVDIQVAFSIFVLLETWLAPFEGHLVDRFGPRLIVLIGGVLVGASWIINSVASSLSLLYLGAAIGGIGMGTVYGTCVGNALKWFPDRRGLATGITAAAFGAGSALTLIPIRHVIKTYGYQSAFLWFGIAQGIIVLLCALLLRAPMLGAEPAGEKATVRQSARDFHWREMLYTPTFWLLYVMFIAVATGGLMATAQLGPIARDFKVSGESVSLLGITMAALPFALALDRILNGISRPLFGWLSDYLGRENTMFLVFGLEGCTILLLLSFAHSPVMFVVLSGVAFFAWGEIFSLFPALSGDLFGRKFATTNYGLLYTAKGIAALLVPIGSMLEVATGSWKPIFGLAVALDWTAALLALFILKPLCVRWLAAQRSSASPSTRDLEPAAQS
jgi:OFA family oxalate/formate antiporter-like MFS transporter